MTKQQELDISESCFNRARPEEFIFVLLERDLAFSDTIRHWIKRRIELGKNSENDEQIVQARKLVAYVDMTRVKEA